MSLCGYRVYIIWHEADGPVLEVVGHVVLSVCGGDGHIARDALVVFDGASEVDASHGLYKDVDLRAFLHGWQHDALLVFHAVDLPNKLPVDEHLRIVVGIADGEAAGLTNVGQGSGVEGRAPSHVHFLEGLRVVALHRACDELP